MAEQTPPTTSYEQTHDRPGETVDDKTTGSQQVYWAAKSPKELIASLDNLIKGYYEKLSRHGLHYLWRRSYYTYYGSDSSYGATHGTSAIQFGGVQGELSFIKINHYRSLQQNILNMTTQQMPRWEPRAINNDWQTAAQVSVSRGVLEYYMRDKRLDMVFRDVVERGLIFAEGFCWLNWDPAGGEVVKPQEGEAPSPTGMPRHTGEMWFSPLSPRDVIRNTRRRWDDGDWVIVRQVRNKFDLAARYPAKAEYLIGLEGNDQLIEAYDYERGDLASVDEADDVSIYHFYHDRTDAMPDGRYLVMAGTEFLFDVALPYKEIPVYRLAPGDIMGSGWGYSNGFDLLGPQEGYDAVYSMILTALDAHGVASVAYPQDAELTVLDLAGGLRGLRVKSMDHLPQSLSLLNISEDTYRFLGLTKETMEVLSGVNETARGQSKEGESGAHAALMQSLAIQSNTGMQKAYKNLLEDVGTGVVRILADYADEPQIALIVGQDQRYKIQQFTKDDIRSIDRVQVDLGNPILSTGAGRFDLAMRMLDKGLIYMPEQLWTVLETGRLDSVFMGVYGQMETAKRENELLAQGPPVVQVADPNKAPMIDPATGQQIPGMRNVVDGVMALQIDMHQKHIHQHREVLNSPEARNIPQVMAAVMAHIDDHMYQLMITPPELLMMLGETPVDPTMAMGGLGAPSGPAEVGTPTGPAGGTGSLEVGGAEGAPGMPEAPTVGGELPAGMPSLPKNPATGETAKPFGG